MNTLVVFILFFAFIAGNVDTHPADHREDTVLPFSLSPGNVNLETYYLDKYPKPGPGGPLKKQPPKGSQVDDNAFTDNEDVPDAHAIFRSRRAANPQYYPRQIGGHNHGYEHYQLHHESSYGHEHHRQSDRHHEHRPQHHLNNFNHFHG